MGRRMTVAASVFALVTVLGAIEPGILQYGGAQAATDAIVNGGFETGNLSGWSSSNTAGYPAPAMSTAAVHFGAYAAFLGDPNDVNGGDACIYQNVTLSTTATLSFWYVASTEDSLPWDWQDAYIRASGTTGCSESGSQLLHQAANVSSWTQISTTLTAGSYQIYFGIHDDGSGDPTLMCVDDVSLAGVNLGPPINTTNCSSSVPPSNTATSTPTNSPTNTSTTTPTTTSTPTNTPTAVPTATSIPTNTPITIPTDIPTATHTSTPTATHTSTPTATATTIDTATPVPPATHTALPPTAIPTHTSAPTAPPATATVRPLGTAAVRPHGTPVALVIHTYPVSSGRPSTNEPLTLCVPAPAHARVRARLVLTRSGHGAQTAHKTVRRGVYRVTLYGIAGASGRLCGTVPQADLPATTLRGTLIVTVFGKHPRTIQTTIVVQRGRGNGSATVAKRRAHDHARRASL